MHQRHAMGRAPARDHARCFGIGTERRFGLLLGTVHRGIGRGVDHHRGPHAVQQRRQATGLVEISHFAGAAVMQGAATGGSHHRAQRRQRAQQLPANLAVAAEHQHRHGAYTGSRSSAMSFRNGALSSLAESVGALIGQSTAMSASFQRTPASASFT